MSRLTQPRLDVITVGTPIGIIAFSYGRREIEPSPCNLKLANEVRRLSVELTDLGHEVYIGAEWEVALGLKLYDWCVRPSLTEYLGSQGVIAETKAKLLDRFGITTVVPVVQPYLQSIAVRRHLAQAGLEVEPRSIRPIGHDRQSVQPWTRSAEALTIYAAWQLLTKHKGDVIVTDQMRHLVESGQPPRRKR